MTVCTRVKVSITKQESRKDSHVFLVICHNVKRQTGVKGARNTRAFAVVWLR